MSDTKEKKKDKSKIFIILLFVLSIILIGAGVILTILDDDDDLEISKEEVVKEVEVTDTVLIEKIEKNINLIEEFSIIGEYSSKDVFGRGVIYAFDFNDSDISSQTKLLTILEKLYLEKAGNSPVTTEFNFGENHEYFKSIQTQISVSEVEELYKDTFGDDIVHNDVGTCLYFIYDEENSMYYGSSTCSPNTTLYRLDNYVSSITTKGNNLYAYVSLGAGDYSGESVKVYVDYDMKTLHNGGVRDSSNLVNRNNYKEFSQYKYTFVKKDDNYVFEKIEKMG